MNQLTRLTAVLGALLIAGCATAPEGSRVDYDPWEPLNRNLYAVNDAADKAILKPIAKGYKFILPDFARRGITNFSRNLATPLNSINHFLQGKPRDGTNEFARFLFNSTLGIGGLIDIAEKGGLERKPEDFGQTFAVWGIPEGPYVIVPFIGPRSLSHAVSLPLNIWADPLWHYEVSSVRDKLEILRIINLRANLLTAERFLEDSKDPYVTLRESYLQNRQYEIHDGDPPIDDDFYEEFDEAFEDFDDDPGNDGG